MRKTKVCVATCMDTLAGRLVVRVCTLERGHQGHRHEDVYGIWAMEEASGGQPAR